MSTDPVVFFVSVLYSIIIVTYESALFLFVICCILVAAEMGVAGETALIFLIAVWVTLLNCRYAGWIG